LEAVERVLRALDLSFEEWAVLSREKLLIERNLLLVATGLMRRPKDLTEVALRSELRSACAPATRLRLG
jgi:hypothetical protein